MPCWRKVRTSVSTMIKCRWTIRGWMHLLLRQEVADVVRPAVEPRGRQRLGSRERGGDVLALEVADEAPAVDRAVGDAVLIGETCAVPSMRVSSAYMRALAM